MISFKATYFDGTISTPHRVQVRSDGAGLRIRFETDSRPEIRFALKDCHFRPPLGKANRSILLPGGARCDTEDREAAAVLEAHRGLNRGMRMVGFIESRWKLALGSLAGLVLCIWSLTSFGIPLLADFAAAAVPAEFSRELSRQALEVLDTRFFEPSQLDRDRSAELQKLFRRIVDHQGSRMHPVLEFRKGGPVGPNAMALPSGLILVTDELVALAANDHDIAGVMAHEIAHVENRHGLRTLFQNTGVFLLLSVLAGDVTSVTSLAGILPLILIKSGYSRRFESEADRAAGTLLVEMGWGTAPFRNILTRISHETPGRPVYSLFATHPNLDERIRLLKQLDADD